MEEEGPRREDGDEEEEQERFQEQNEREEKISKFKKKRRRKENQRKTCNGADNFSTFPSHFFSGSLKNTFYATDHEREKENMALHPKQVDSYSCSNRERNGRREYLRRSCSKDHGGREESRQTGLVAFFSFSFFPPASFFLDEIQTFS